MIDFPNSPAIGQIFSAVGVQWKWDGVKWVPLGGGPFLPLTGGTLSGLLTLHSAPAADTWLTINGTHPWRIGVEDATGIFDIIDNTAGVVRLGITTGGFVTMPIGLVVGGSAATDPGTVGVVVAEGSTATYVLYDRTTANWRWAFYSTGKLLTLGNTDATAYTFGSAGAFGASGVITAGGAINTTFGTGAQYLINGSAVIYRDATWTYFYDASARQALFLGGSSQNRNIYSSNSHEFYSVGNSTLYAQLTSGGLNLPSAATYQIGGQVAMAHVSNSVTIYDGDARPAIICWGSAANQITYENSIHWFGAVGAASQYAMFDSSGTRNVSGAWLTLSDIRIKEDVVDYKRGLDAICQLRPVNFKYNGRAETTRDDRVQLGFVADEVLPVMPELVKVTQQRLDPEDEDLTELLVLESSNVIYALVNAVHELRDRVVALEQAA
jgi:hypothetical protein